MRVDSAVTWPETSEVLISQSRLQTLRFGTRITGPKRLKPLRVDSRFSCWNWLRLCVCTGCILCILYHFVHWYNIIQQLSWFIWPSINKFAAGPVAFDRPAQESSRTSIPTWFVTLMIYKARACVCHLLNKVNAHAKSDLDLTWIAFCDHILASTSGDLANWTSSTWNGIHFEVSMITKLIGIMPHPRSKI